MYILLNHTVGGAPVGAEGDMRISGVLSVVFKIPKCTSHPGIGLVEDGKANHSAKDSGGDPVLYRAIRGQFVEIIRILVDADADVNAETADGESLLTKAKKTQNDQIINILEAKGATE